MRRVIVALMLTVIVCCDVWSKTYVVSVGINTYPQGNSLRACVNDATSISKIFQNNGNAEINLILNNNATRATILRYLRQMFLKAGKSDAILLYFSGHGAPGGFICYDGMLDYKSILAVMRQSSASKKMIIADVCFAGTARIPGHRQGSHSSDNVMFFLSSRSNEISTELNDNGRFTYFLKSGLLGDADANRDRRVTAIELYTFVHNRVSQSSRNKQHPVMWGRFNNNMTIIQW